VAGEAARALKAAWARTSRLAAELIRSELTDLAPVLLPDGPRGVRVGAGTAALVVAAAVHPVRFRRPRDLWAYCGFGVEDGHASPRGRRDLRRRLLSVARQSWASADPGRCHWRALHDAEVERILSRPSPPAKGRASAMAWRRVVQAWLADLWLGWRAVEVRRGRWPEWWRSSGGC
jgi:hypothetical protein